MLPAVSAFQHATESRRHRPSGTTLFIPALCIAVACLALSACDDGGGETSSMGDAEDTVGDSTLDTGVATDQREEDTLVSEDTAPPAPVCGNNRLEGDEACDTRKLDGATCASLLSTSHAIGDPSCTDDCTIDQSECEAVVCGAAEKVVGGGCATIATPDDYVPSSDLSYVAAIDMVADPPQPPCCFDLDGDGSVDNALKDLLTGLLATGTGGLDLTAGMNEAIANGELVMVYEFRGLPMLPASEASLDGVSAFRASTDVDGDGQPDQDMATRLAGDGVYQLDRDAFGEAGAISQFNRATVDGSVVTADWGHLELDVVVPGLFSLTVGVDRALMRFDVRREANGMFSNDAEMMSNEETFVVHGAEIGGVVRMSELVDVINEMAGECSCAGLSPGDEVLAVEENGRLNLECTNTEFDDGVCTQDPAEGGGFICTQLTLLCGATTLLAAIPDIDTNANGIADAVSTGIRMQLVGASLADPPVEPAP